MAGDRPPDPPDDARDPSAAGADTPDGALAEWLERALAGEAPDPDLIAEDRGLSPAELRDRIGVARWLVGRHRGARAQGMAALPAAPFRVGGFTALEEAGRGAMGVVYRAVQDGLDRPAAVKVMNPAVDGSGRARLRFLHEARAASRLTHPHIVRVIDVGEQDGLAWYAMEWIDGESLAALLARRRHGQRAPDLDELRESASLVARIAHALQHAHDHGLLHRDVKPANIMVDARGEPRLADFGLVKDEAAATVTRSGDVVGSPAYMSPEQLRGQRALAPASDVYSLGVTLYECLTLSRPFEATTVDHLAHRISTESPPPPRSLVPSIPEDLQRVCLKAIAAEPAARYASAAAFAVDLEAFLRGEPVAARPETAGARLRRRARRHARALGLCASLGVVATLVWVALSARSELSANARSICDKELVEARMFGDEDAYRERLALAVGAYPRDVELRLLAAILALEEGAVVRAEAELAAATLGADATPAVARLAAGLAEGLAFVREGRLDAAGAATVDQLSRIDERTDVDGRALLMRGQILLLLGRLEQAELLFERARFVAPELGRHAALGLSRCWLARGEHERALDLLEMFVTEASPAYAFYRLVSLARAAGDDARASACADRLRAYHPTSGFNAVAELLELRDAAVSSGDATELVAAAPALSAAAESSPDWSAAVEPVWRSALGTVLVESGHPAEGAEVLDRLVAAHPERINSRAMLGVALCKSGARERGLAVLKQVAEACDDRPGERDARWATYWYHAGEFQRAIDHGRESVRRYPDDPARWQVLGDAWLALALRATRNSLRAQALEEATTAYGRALACLPSPTVLLAQIHALGFLQVTYELRSGPTDPGAVRCVETRRALERDHEGLAAPLGPRIAAVDADVAAFRDAQLRFAEERRRASGK